MTGSWRFLDGRVCLVTGSSRKVGKAMAFALADCGADVAVHYRSSRIEAARAAARIRAQGRHSCAVRADVTRERDVERLFAAVTGKLGAPAILINNVGDFLLKPLAKVTPKQWHAILASNLHSAFLCTRQALPAMRRAGFGRIINMGFGSCERFQARDRTAVYHMAKTALLVYTKAVAREEARHGITVNMISPGTIFTSVNRPPLSAIPAGRYARYHDIAAAVLYLVSPQAAYVTGANLLLTGGKDV